jgi:class 3 adenylate cyclase
MGQDAKLERRLAAILATDVVGYSKLMQSDEAAALAALAAIREATQNQIRGHRGRIANTAENSVLAEFRSAVEAVSCAMALQETLAKESGNKDLQLRIGIHLGDVVDKIGTTCSERTAMDGLLGSGRASPARIMPDESETGFGGKRVCPKGLLVVLQGL